jgi:L-methionine (R)-S-oxide reductase
MALPRLLQRLDAIVEEDSTRSAKALQMAEAIRNDGDYRWVGLYDVDRERGLVSNIAWSGPNAPAYPTFPITKGLTSRAIATKATVNVGDVAKDASYLTALESTRSEIIVPVLDRASEVIGTIDVESASVDAFDAASQQRLEEVARRFASFWLATV